MKSLNFANGYKEYMINNDPNKVIRINSSDLGIVKRAREAQEKINSIILSNDTETDAEMLNTTVREQLDYIFGAGVSDIAFGSTNVMSIAGGAPIFQNFIDAILPIIEEDITKEKELSDKRISNYTSRVK